VLESADPEREFEKDVWDLRVFGKPQAYRLDFTAIRQPWLRMLAKEWAREKAPRVHGACLKRMVLSLNELSTALARRPDKGADPSALGRDEIAAFLGRLGRLQSTGRVTVWLRRQIVNDVSQFLREARDYCLGPDERPLFGLPGDFSLSRDDVRALGRNTRREPQRELPEAVIAQLLDTPALMALEAMHGTTARAAIELLTDTGRRPNEICILVWDCLHYDTHVDETGQTVKLPVLVHDMPKVGIRDFRLPIDETTARLIIAQKARVRERYPDTPPDRLMLLPRGSCNPHGHRPMPVSGLSRVTRHWADTLATLLGPDGAEFPRVRVIPYAFRHSYAQRHADNGTPVDVLSELMGHDSLKTTQG
jgi:integrase